MGRSSAVLLGIVSNNFNQIVTSIVSFNFSTFILTVFMTMNDYLFLNFGCQVGCFYLCKLPNTHHFTFWSLVKLENKNSELNSLKTFYTILQDLDAAMIWSYLIFLSTLDLFNLFPSLLSIYPLLVFTVSLYCPFHSLFSFLLPLVCFIYIACFPILASVSLAISFLLPLYFVSPRERSWRQRVVQNNTHVIARVTSVF